MHGIYIHTRAPYLYIQVASDLDNREMLDLLEEFEIAFPDIKFVVLPSDEHKGPYGKNANTPVYAKAVSPAEFDHEVNGEITCEESCEKTHEVERDAEA